MVNSVRERHAPAAPTVPAAHDLDGVFAALADPTRRGILERLAQGEATVGELAAPYAISLPAVSRHVKVLERAGLLERRIDGRVHRCRLQPEALVTANQWVERHRAFWEAQFDRLAAFLDGPAPTSPQAEPAAQPATHPAARKQSNRSNRSEQSKQSKQGGR